ncbi:penicillin acylase family protein [Terriglobus aquaticus]|uniref:Penicillin acylase family protein n=1 Tax=Terriglobus aquaticus TaxID=940139 RepID=A0ABW9KHE1_9BACT|nr:penicillin acylase family protein [Terriglobus aquaticus]
MPTATTAPKRLTPTAYRRNRRMRRGIAVVVTLLVLAAVATIAARLWLRHAIAAGAPTLDGTLHVSGLSAPVRVRRDAYGIPHIQAANEDDLLVAQGYVTAQDRLWQMDMLRRHAAGELAEILGSDMLEHDRTQRYLQLRAVADRSVDELDPAERHALEQYSRGVNAAIAAAENGSGALPAEFRLLGYTPRPWTPRDSLLVGFAMAQDLSTGYPNKLNREAVTADLSPEMAADLYPTTTFRDHPPAEGHKDLSAPREMIEIPLDDSQVKLEAPQQFEDHLRDLQHANAILAASVSGLRCDGCTAGSNNWVVSGARSASGKPMLANDMHLSITVPGIWYTATLDAPNLSVAGVTLPGVPYVIVGHNSHVAWGFTNSSADAQDLYVEQRHGDTYTASDGSSQPIEHRTETILVKHGLNTTLDIAFTRHGGVATPILTPLFPHEKRTLALRWTLYDPGFASMPFDRANRAGTGAELEEAFRNFGGPSQNLVWGDDSGHIGYHLIGFVPLRNAPAVGSTVTFAQSGEQSPTVPPSLADDSTPIGVDGNPILPSASAPGSPSPQASTAPQSPSSAQTGSTAFVPISGHHALAPVPVPAGQYEWAQRIPYDQLPRVTDPASGILATANARITSDSYPYPISLDWEAPYRNERIWRALGDRTGLTPADMTALQDDVFSAFDRTLAERVAYAVDHVKSPSKRAREAANLLRSWDGRVTLEAAQPNITQAVRSALLTILLEPRLGRDGLLLYTPHARAYALEMLIEHAQPRWLPAGYADWNALLAAALERGLKDAHAPGKLSTWRWSGMNRIALGHPVFAKTWYLRWLSGAGSVEAPLPGNAYTVHVASGIHGASERFVVDLAQPEQGTMTLPLGESGNFRSPYFANQFPAWSTGKPLPMTGAAATHQLTLAP